MDLNVKRDSIVKIIITTALLFLLASCSNKAMLSGATGIKNDKPKPKQAEPEQKEAEQEAAAKPKKIKPKKKDETYEDERGETMESFDFQGFRFS